MRARIFVSTLWELLVVLVAGGCATYQPQPLAPGSSAAAFEERRLDSPALHQLVRANHQPALAGTGLAEWTREALVLAALYDHPALAVPRARWRGAQAAEITAGMRPNPTLAVIGEFDFVRPGGLSPWAPGLSLDFPIETMGRRALRLALARQNTETARLELHEAAWRVRAEVRDALVENRFLRQQTNLLAAQLDLQEKILRLIERRVAAGGVAPAELLPHQLAAQRTTLDLQGARERAAAAVPRLAAALGVTAQELSRAVGEPGFRRVFEETPGGAAPSQSALAEARARAVQGRPDLRVLLAAYESAELGLRLEVVRQYPNLNLGSGYKWNQGESEWSFTRIGLDLPVMNQNQGPIAEAEARRSEAAARVQARQAQIFGEVDAALAALAQAHASVSAARALVGVQRQQQELAIAQRRAGAADDTEVRVAELQGINAQLLLADASNRLERAEALLEDALRQSVRFPIETAPAAPATHEK